MTLVLIVTDYIWEQSDVWALYWKPGKYHDNAQGDIMITPQTFITPRQWRTHHSFDTKTTFKFIVNIGYFGLFWIITIFLAGASALIKMIVIIQNSQKLIEYPIHSYIFLILIIKLNSFYIYLFNNNFFYKILNGDLLFPEENYISGKLLLCLFYYCRRFVFRIQFHFPGLYLGNRSPSREDFKTDSMLYSIDLLQ